MLWRKTAVFQSKMTLNTRALAIFASLLAVVRARCWFPDGQTVAAQDVPCHSTGNSTCCGQGWACLSNNICEKTSYAQGAGSQYVRGSCTDPTWNDANCPNFCDSPAIGDNQQGGIGMSPCPNSDLEWVCQDSAGSTANCEATLGVVVFQGMSAADPSKKRKY